MNMKQILVPLDVSPFAKVAGEIACEIARRHGGTPSCLTILDRAIAELFFGTQARQVIKRSGASVFIGL